MTKDQLYFDGSCPLCSKEIAMLKRYAYQKLEFIDIHSIDFDQDDKYSANIPSKDELLKLLHLRLANGEWLVGLDANVHMWSNTKFGMVLSILRWPIINRLADFTYQWWAKSRYKKRYECGSCNLNN